MSKTKKIDLEKKIISQIKSEKIRMKPKWYFVLGSLLLFVSLVGLGIGAAFLVNLLVFFLRRNGPFRIVKLQAVLATFPWWIVVIAIMVMVVAILFLKRYDFSYKKNFVLIVMMFVVAILSAGFLLDKLGLNEYLSKGAMRGYYQRLEMYDIKGDLSGRGVGKGCKGLNFR